ncbi:hypothetical protein KSP35_04085 [Aquihabitans sp. G128]|uniref:hypothetical protein n=1 Tax=Aquihabitans sp. G128 TaxID=2849779 RepID=UPI001C21F881|nr:hypothetical protein [Aquihabitans sp. G128]QXC62005.1 hypothetical protein KSP35_04085 [Aquihabitans sp. G128]
MTTSAICTSAVDPSRVDAGRGGVQQGEAVEGLLGPDLLPDPDERVQHQDAGEEGVTEAPGGDDRHRQHGEDGVEPGEHVGPHDVAERAGGALVDAVGEAVPDPGGHLGGGEAALGGVHHLVLGVGQGPLSFGCRRTGGRWQATGGTTSLAHRSGRSTRSGEGPPG